jgi:hypothetical protein
MKTLQVLTLGLAFGAIAMAASAADEPNILTVTVTAKRHATVPASQLAPPRAHVEVPVILPTDMPEAEIHYHLSPIGAPPAPAVPQATP